RLLSMCIATLCLHPRSTLFPYTTLFRSERDILKNICLIKEGDNFQKDMTVKQILKSYRFFYPNWDQDLANELVKEYQLPLKKRIDRKSTRLNSSHVSISYAVFCLKKKKQ